MVFNVEYAKLNPMQIEKIMLINNKKIHYNLLNIIYNLVIRNFL